jgi:flavin-dependent dehydrogenase
LAGDALGFLDPVFSSGVFLALKSGVMLADEIDEIIKNGEAFTSGSFDSYGKRMHASIEIMRKIVYAFYDENFSFRDLIKRGESIRASLTDCLIGNVDEQDFHELFEAMADLVDLPQPVECGLAHATS